MSNSNEINDTNGNAAGHGDENILDDLMQNSVQFDEDEKPAAKSDDKDSDDDGEVDEDPKDEKTNANENHSDISENDSEPDSVSSDEEMEDGEKTDETWSPTKNQKRSSKSPSPQKVQPEDHSDISEEEDENFGKDNKGESNNTKNSKKTESGSENDEVEEKAKEKKPSLASRVSRPAPITAPTDSTSSSTSQLKEKKKKTGKSYDYATKLNYLFRDARFFLVKSSVSENVSLSKVRGVWSTPPANEIRFNKAYKESRNVLLIYSVKESGKFCGLARLATESRRDGPRVPWILPPGLSAKALGGVFKIDWICKRDLPFTKVSHLQNPWNEKKPVKIGRDGQEIEPSIAEELCRLFPVDDEIDMTPILRRSKESARRQRSRPESERQSDVPHTRPLADRIRPNTQSQDNYARKRPHNRIGGGRVEAFEPASRPKYNKRSPTSRNEGYMQGSRRDQGGHRGHHRGGQRGHGGSGGSHDARSRLPSYQEYMRSRNSGGGGGGTGSGMTNSNSARTGGYPRQDDDYLYDRRSTSSRPSYERSVDMFLKRTGEVRRHHRR